MRLEDAVKVWKLATPEEKRRLKPIFAQKAESAADRLGSLPEKQRKKLATQILEILNEQVPNPPPGE
jgi:hypothetical protein